MAFHFRDKERVYVPGTKMAQGMVMDRTETIPGFPVYVVKWIGDDGEINLGSCGELDLLCTTLAAKEVILRNAESAGKAPTLSIVTKTKRRR